MKKFNAVFLTVSTHPAATSCHNIEKELEAEDKQHAYEIAKRYISFLKDESKASKSTWYFALVMLEESK